MFLHTFYLTINLSFRKGIASKKVTAERLFWLHDTKKEDAESRFPVDDSMHLLFIVINIA